MRITLKTLCVIYYLKRIKGMIKALTQACKPWMIVRRAEKDVGLPFAENAQRKRNLISFVGLIISAPEIGNSTE